MQNIIRYYYYDTISKMKNNQYLEKYGEKALELYNKKSLKQNNSGENNNSEEEQDLVNQNKNTHKQYEKPLKSGSQKSLSRNSKSKSKISISQNQSNYTFQKPINLNQLQLQIQDKDKNRKKLLLSGLSTPKNNRSARLAVQNDQKAQSSSTKKKPLQAKIAQKLNDALYKNKSAKLMVKQLMQCLDMVCQHQNKINKWITQFKQIVLQIADEATHFRKKFKQQSLKNKKLQKDYQQFESTLKSNNQKKRKPLQLNIMQENQKLRQRIEKLQRQIQNYEKKEMILIQTLQKIKTPKPFHFETKSTTKKEDNHLAKRIKRQFYGNLHEEDDDDQSENQPSQQHLENL